MLLRHGFDDKEIISKEGGTNTDVFDNPCYGLQTETEQAEFLIKRAVYLSAKNLSIINWSYLEEHGLISLILLLNPLGIQKKLLFLWEESLCTLKHSILSVSLTLKMEHD